MKKFQLASIGLLLGIMLIACSNDEDSGQEENNTPEETISADQFAMNF